MPRYKYTGITPITIPGYGTIARNEEVFLPDEHDILRRSPEVFELVGLDRRTDQTPSRILADLLDPETGLIKPDRLPNSSGENYVIVPVTVDPIQNGENLRSAVASLPAAPFGEEYIGDGSMGEKISRTVILPPGIYDLGTTLLSVPDGVTIVGLSERCSVTIVGPISVDDSAHNIRFISESAANGLLILNTGGTTSLYNCTLQGAGGADGSAFATGSAGSVYCERCGFVVSIGTGISKLTLNECWGVSMGDARDHVKLFNISDMNFDILRTSVFFSGCSNVCGKATDSDVYLGSSSPVLVMSGGYLDTVMFSGSAGSHSVIAGDFYGVRVNIGAYTDLSGSTFQNCRISAPSYSPYLVAGNNVSMLQCAISDARVLQPASAGPMLLLGCSLPPGYTLHANITLASGTLANGYNYVRPSGWTVWTASTIPDALS